jgi:hypothetical protein
VRSNQYSKTNLTQNHITPISPGSTTLSIKNFKIPTSGQFILKVRFESLICADCCKPNCKNVSPPIEKQGRTVYTYNTPFMFPTEKIDIDLKFNSCRCCP